jgi:Spy/CpxP family protein refolding chaperone
MRRINGSLLLAVLIATALMLCIAVVVMAAEEKKAVPAEVDPAACLEACIQLVRTDVQADKARLVAANLVLTDKEAERFWPMYRKYDVEMTEINDRTVAFLKEYAEAGGVFTDQRAAELLGEWFDIQDQKLRVRRHYSKEFRQVMPSAKVSRFFQIDNRIDLALQLQIASGLPLLKRAGGN